MKLISYREQQRALCQAPAGKFRVLLKYLEGGHLNFVGDYDPEDLPGFMECAECELQVYDEAGNERSHGMWFLD